MRNCQFQIDAVDTKVKLSTLICSNCVETLKMVLAFKRRCIQNQRILNEYVINKLSLEYTLREPTVVANFEFCDVDGDKRDDSNMQQPAEQPAQQPAQLLVNGYQFLLY